LQPQAGYVMIPSPTASASYSGAAEKWQ